MAKRIGKRHTQRVLSRKAFEKWLREKKPGELVGARCDPHCCPIASFMGDGGYADSRVYVAAGQDFQPTPPWAIYFIIGVDGSGLQPSRITAKRALEILRSIP